VRPHFHRPAELIKLLDDPDDSVRAEAAAALGPAQAAGAVEPLRRLLKDRSLVVVYSAARSLGQLGGRWAADALLEAISQAESHVPAPFLEPLARTRDERAYEALVPATLTGMYVQPMPRGYLGDKRAAGPRLHKSLKEPPKLFRERRNRLKSRRGGLFCRQIPAAIPPNVTFVVQNLMQDPCRTPAFVAQNSCRSQA